jgi:hypothetical protein
VETFFSVTVVPGVQVWVPITAEPTLNVIVAVQTGQAVPPAQVQPDGHAAHSLPTCGLPLPLSQEPLYFRYLFEAHDVYFKTVSHIGFSANDVDGIKNTPHINIAPKNARVQRQVAIPIFSQKLAIFYSFSIKSFHFYKSSVENF